MNPLAIPNEAVTTENFKQYSLKHKDEKSKNKRLVWCLDCEDDFVHPFKQSIRNNEFTQIREVQDAASKLYAEHCPDAQRSKATVYTNAEGQRAVKKKIEVDADETVAENTTEIPENVKIIIANLAMVFCKIIERNRNV